jgi:transcriptional regulator with XRE-family HTH domain
LLGRRIAELRKKACLTQAELAEEANFSLRYFQRIEAGDVNISALSIIRVANALEVRPGQLFTIPRRTKKPKRGRPPGS